MSNVTAIASGVRVSPRKAGEVASLVRGRSVADAVVILEHTPRRAALPIAKLIKSASANAEAKGLDVKSLQIASLSVGPGFAMKRFRPAAHGRALPYKKQTSNISVELSGAKKAVKKPATKKAEATTKKAATAKTTTKSQAKGKES